MTMVMHARRAGSLAVDVENQSRLDASVCDGPNHDSPKSSGSVLVCLSASRPKRVLQNLASLLLLFLQREEKGG
jgi:hypothetical protein